MELQLAEKRISAMEKELSTDNRKDAESLKQQLSRKSELLEKVKDLLARAAINEKALRQRVNDGFVTLLVALIRLVR